MHTPNNLGRRSFLFRSAAAAGVGALSIAPFVGGCVGEVSTDDSGTQALGATGRRRKAWHTLTAAEKDLYRRAVVALNAEKVTGSLDYTTQFQRFASVHNNSCPHGNWFFLPWHRVYIAFYESELVRVLGADGANFALPYWDWSATPSIPSEFIGTDLDPVQLHKGTQFAKGRSVTRTFQFDAKSIGPDVVKQLVGLADFYAFASYPAKGTNGMNDRARSGQLESVPHNYVHATIGGNMGTFLSPLDPIFYLHHCNVDRIWNLWLSARAKAGQDVLPFEGPKLSGVAKLRDFWMGFAYSLRADSGTGASGDFLQKGNNTTKEVLDSRGFRVKLRDGSPSTIGFSYDTDPQSVPAAAVRLAQTSTRVDFTPQRIVTSDNTFTAKIKTADAAPAVDAFNSGGAAATMTILFDNLPVPEDAAVRNAVVLVIRIAEADIVPPHPTARHRELGQISFFSHGVSGAHAAHVDGAIVASALDVTPFFTELQNGTGAPAPSVWISGEFVIKKGFAEPPGWAAWKAQLPALLKAASKEIDLSLVASV